MNIEELREYCLSLPLATEIMFFKNEYLIFRVFDKWFAVIPLNDLKFNVSLKCNPDYAIELRETNKNINPAWHFNKKYWNNIILNGEMNDELVKELIRHSIDEVISKLPKKFKLEYESLKTW